jgi:hypothetical protein
MLLCDLLLKCLAGAITMLLCVCCDVWPGAMSIYSAYAAMFGGTRRYCCSAYAAMFGRIAMLLCVCCNVWRGAMSVSDALRFAAVWAS